MDVRGRGVCTDRGLELDVPIRTEVEAGRVTGSQHSQLRRRIVTELRRTKRTHSLIDRLAESLGTSRKELEPALDELAAEGLIVRTRKGRVALCERLGLVTGIVRMGRSGRAVVVPDEPDAPVAIARGSLAGAMDGDRVLVEASPYTRRGLRRGSVKAVLERRTQRVVGTVVHAARGGCVFVPRSARADYVASIENPQSAPIEKQLYLATIVKHPTATRGPTVRIEHPLGTAGTLPAEIEAVCCAHGIPRGFSAEAEQEASSFSEPTAAGTRVDLTNRLLVTIDPADARDFDDAVGIERTRNGYRVTVAIADVSHYVRPGTALDAEALDRATSVYFPGTCSPMLPAALSSNLASLRPDRVRLAVAILLDVDREGVVMRHRGVRAVVRSRRRLTYEQAQDLLDRRDDSPEARALADLEAVATALRRRRMQRGAIDLDIPELEVEVDENGEPAAIRRRPRLAAHRIIEELMLAANEAVAGMLEEAQTAFLYRIHEAPDEESIATLAARLSLLGLHLERDGATVGPAAFQSVIEQARGRPFERLVHTMCLRAMKQARYSAYKTQHFGLASSCYTHFTSPIRRYPDLVVHRRLCRLIAGDPADSVTQRQLEPIAEHCSQRERRAMEAERDIGRAAAVLYAQRHLGAAFDGTVTGVDRRGYWVELDDLAIEGFVPVGRLSEYYEFIEERMELHSRTSRAVVHIGMRQRVRLEAADLTERRIDLAPCRP